MKKIRLIFAVLVMLALGMTAPSCSNHASKSSSNRASQSNSNHALRSSRLLEESNRLFAEALNEKDLDKQIELFSRVIRLESAVAFRTDIPAERQLFTGTATRTMTTTEAIDFGTAYAGARPRTDIPPGRVDIDIARADFSGTHISRTYNPESNIIRAYAGRGLAFLQTGMFDNAIMDFSRVIESDLTNVEAFGNRGVAFGGIGEFDNAIADFNKAIELSPKTDAAYFSIYINRGIALREKGDFDNAIMDFNTVIESDPTNTEAYYNRAFTYRAMFIAEEDPAKKAEYLRRAEADAVKWQELRGKE